MPISTNLLTILALDDVITVFSAQAPYYTSNPSLLWVKETSHYTFKLKKFFTTHSTRVFSVSKSSAQFHSRPPARWAGPKQKENDKIISDYFPNFKKNKIWVKSQILKNNLFKVSYRELYFSKKVLHRNFSNYDFVSQIWRKIWKYKNKFKIK